MNNSSLLGIIFMLINTFSLSILDITAKHLKTNMNAAQIVFFYKSSLLLLMLPWVLKEGLAGLKTTKIKIHLFRSFFSVMGSICFVHGLYYVDMADAAALENIQYIMIIVIGMVFFKEKCTKTKVFATIFGFMGAIIIVCPDIINFNSNSNPFVKINKNYFY